MQKSFAFLLIACMVCFTLVPAYYPPGDEALRQTSTFSDVYSQFFTSSSAISDFSNAQAWTGISLSWNVSFVFPQYVPSSPATRAPPL
jgi:hypothetical protein